MAVKMEIPTALRQFAGKQASVEFNAGTVGDALKQLTGTYADLRKHLYTEDGRIRSFVNIYLNDEDIRYLQKENTPTKDGDTISIVPSIAGGCPSYKREVIREKS
jgi:molybdopterin converting factor small subunit